MRGARRLGMRRWLAPIIVVALLPLGVAPVASQDGPGQVTVVDAFEADGDVATADWVLAWNVSRAEAQWHIAAQHPDGGYVQLELLTEDGDRIDRTNGNGSAELFDIGLVPGRYLLRVPVSRDATSMVGLRASVQDESYDPEPNDTSESAVDLADGASVKGRLARSSGDRDRYRVVVRPGSSVLREVDLTWLEGPQRQLCLLGADGRDRACRSGSGRATLHDLLLEEGEHYLEVRGSTDASVAYEIGLQVSDPPRPGWEIEPNDTPATGIPVSLDLGVGGRSGPDDRDHFILDVEGEPQLWRLDAIGEDLEYLAWLRPDGKELARARDSGEGSASLVDLLLVPGSHVFMLRTRGGAYRLQVTPLGAPAPDREREPNDDETTAEAYAIGERRSGRLFTPDDRDGYRFTITAPQHVRLRLAHPAGGLFEARLETGGAELLRQWPSQPGEDLQVDLWLDLGDYLLSLRARQPDEGEYELTTERLDPFVLPVDLEPNHEALLARPVPPSLSWGGGPAGANQDDDWYVLPALPVPAEVVLRIEADRSRMKLYAGSDRSSGIRLRKDGDGSLVTEEVPSDVPLYLRVQASGPYALRAESPAWQPVPDPVAPNMAMDLRLDASAVAAYWPEAQLVEGRLRLANEGITTLDVELETHSSHFGWRVELPEKRVTLPGGATREVPIEVHIRPDAWAGEAVRVSLAGRTPDGGLRTASVSLMASPDAVAVSPSLGWTVPEPLLGGLNVASLGLGALPGGDVDAKREQFLFDGVTPAGAGFGARVPTLPAELVVDLAGEGPVPVAGTIINPLARSFSLAEMPRDFELLLSIDGERWISVLMGQVVPLPMDQAFVLEEPVMASHAMLRVHSLHGRDSYLSLGEWKVIAQPGAATDLTGLDIAAPIRGGHVVRMTPFPGSDFQVRILDPEVRNPPVSVDPDEARFEGVVSFQDGRAAQIVELRWQDPEVSDPAMRLERLRVQVSAEGPLGPWLELGAWGLERSADGSVAPMVLDPPVWARYVRLTSTLPEGLRRLELPEAIGILERPAGEGYRSILGEWGYTSAMGPWEWTAPSRETDPPAAGVDAGDSPDEATPLAGGITATDRVEAGRDEDWYRVTVPAGHNTLHIDATGVPAPEVRVSLLGAEGDVQALARNSLQGGIVRYEAQVEPGGSYLIGVDQPPFNVVFTFDTSGSMGPFLGYVMQGLREFATGVRPGRDAVMIMPFERLPLLDEWADQPLALLEAVETFTRGQDSSNAESALIAASGLLAGREGRRAILLVTDAETTSLNRTPELWEALEAVQPIIYSVHVGASTRPRETRQLMRSWAAAAGGHYAYPTTHAEMDRAFERMSARLRRPAAYSLTAVTMAVSREPGLISVDVDEGRSPLAPGTGVAIILDTSGSMREKLDGRSRIAIARESLELLVREVLPEDTPVSLRVFGGAGGGKTARCKTRLLLPLGPLAQEGTAELIADLGAKKETRTPIAAALRATLGDLTTLDGQGVVVMVTDGAETCGGDPGAAVEDLRASGLDVRVDIVGFALDDEGLKDQMREWAQSGGGLYFDAAGAADLAEAIRDAVGARFRVLDADGGIVAVGRVGGQPVELEPGTYRVEVLLEPPITFDSVTLAGGGRVQLTIRSTDTPR